MTPPRTTHVRWFLIGWLFVLSAVAFLDRVNISIAGSSLASEYHLTDVHLGGIFSAFLLGYALFQTPAGWLADQLGPRRVLAAGVLWWGAFTALTAAVPVTIGKAVLAFVAIRFLLGAGEAVVYPASNQFVARWIPTEERGIANGLIFAGVGVGAGFTPPLITYIMLHHGWRASFWLCATIGVAAGLVWFLAARDTPGQHPGVSAAELATIRAGLTVNVPAAAEHSHAEVAASGAFPPPKAATAPTRMMVPWSTILASRSLWAVTFSYFCFGYVAWIFFSWFYIYLARVRGLNLKASAFYAMLPFLAMAACCPLGGLLSDWLTRRAGKRSGRCGVGAFGAALAAVFLVFGSGVHSAQLSSIVLAGGAGALYLSQSSFWSVTADIAGPCSGSVSGLMNMGAQLGGAVTASLTPYIAVHFGWTTSFLVAAILSFLGSLAWLLVNPTRALAENGRFSEPRPSAAFPRNRAER
jgi:ACS family glucarate transporter-like MFS transporter